MGFIKILRWRVGSRPPRLSRRSRGIESDSLHRAAIFLVVLGQEHATLLFEKFSDEETRLLQSEVHGVSEADRSLVSDVLHEYLEGLSAEHLPQYVSRDDLPDVARAFVRSQPEEVVERMRDLWLQEEVAKGKVVVEKVEGVTNPADLMTKVLNRQVIQDRLRSMNIRMDLKEVVTGEVEEVGQVSCSAEG